MLSIIRIIKEEIENWFDDKPSIADKYYQKNIGIDTKPESQEKKIDAELVGYVTKQARRDLVTPVPVYKNPKTLDGFSDDTRAILMSNGDFYVARDYQALHDNILDLLAEKGIVSYADKFGYFDNYPRGFVAVVREGNSRTFGQSSAYDDFPQYYAQIFEIGEERQPFGFSQYIPN